LDFDWIKLNACSLLSNFDASSKTSFNLKIDSFSNVRASALFSKFFH